MKQHILSRLRHLDIQRENMLLRFEKMSEQQLRFRPEESAWNMLQVLRHIVVAELLSVRSIRKKVARPETLSEKDYRTTFRSLLLSIALRLPFKFKAPDIAMITDPAPDFEESTQKWNASREEFRKLIEQAEPELLTKAIYKHPRAGYLTFDQTITFMQNHVNHHRQQIERIQNHPSFPVK